MDTYGRMWLYFAVSKIQMEALLDLLEWRLAHSFGGYLDDGELR